MYFRLFLGALAVLPLATAVPLASLPDDLSSDDAGTTSAGTGSANTAISPEQSNTATTKSTGTTTSATSASSMASITMTSSGVTITTELPATVPTQNSWVEAMLDLTADQRSGFDHLVYGFEHDGLDSTSALTFANVLEFQEAIWEKVNSRFDTLNQAIEQKQILIIALLIGGIGGFLICGLFYALFVSIRCCVERHKAKKQRKLEERNSFTMVSPPSRQSMRKGEKGSTNDSNGNRWPIDTTPTPKQKAPTGEDIELSNSNHSNSSPKSQPGTPSPPYQYRPSSSSASGDRAPRLTINTHSSSVPRSKSQPAQSSTSTPKGNRRPSTGCTTSISDILAEFDFDVNTSGADVDDEEDRDQAEQKSHFSSSTTYPNLDSHGATTRGRDDGNMTRDGESQVGIISGTRQERMRRDGKYYRKTGPVQGGVRNGGHTY